MLERTKRTFMSAQAVIAIITIAVLLMSRVWTVAGEYLLTTEASAAFGAGLAVLLGSPVSTRRLGSRRSSWVFCQGFSASRTE